jgi:hypothetical protein
MQRLWRVLSRALKWSGIAVAGLLGLALALFALAFAINARDEELSPEARAFLAPPSNPYKPEENIYIALAGLDAPPGESVIAAGVSKVTEFERRIDARLSNPTMPGAVWLVQPPEDPRALGFSGDCSFIHPLQSGFWQEIPQHRESLQKLLAGNGERYQRYLGLQLLRGYYEIPPTNGGTAALAAHWPVCDHKLFLAEYVTRVRSGEPSAQHQAVVDLQGDIRLWSTIFSGEGTMVTKIVAAVYLQGDYLLLADTIADPSIAFPTDEGHADGLVPALDLKHWDLGSTFVSEFRSTSLILREVDALSATAWTPDGVPQGALGRSLARLNNGMRGHFLKLNATENLLARTTARRAQRARDPAMFFRTEKDTPPDPVALPEGLGAWLDLLTYNPGGSVMGVVGGAINDQYTLLVWDAAALQRLVRLGYEIRRQRVQTTGIPAFLKQHPEWSTHPADGRPFLWNAATGELRIQTVARQQPDRRFSIRVWQAASSG